jgi:protein pelota
MQILKQDKKEQLIKLLIQNQEDLWHLSNIIEAGDRVEAVSFRSYKANEQAEVEKKKVTILLEVEKVEFSKTTQHLRITGKIINGYPEEYIQKGSYHTLDIEQGYPITIIKDWKNYHINRIKKAIEQTKRPKLYILLMDEKKVLFAIVRGFGIEYKWEEEFKISKKQAKDYDKEKEKIFEQIKQRLEELEEGEILLAGPGFEAKNFYEYLKNKKNPLIKKIILEHCSYVEKSGVRELLKKGLVHKVIEQQQIALEIKLIEEFKLLLIKNSKKITYGLENIKKALELNAIEKLLILDNLITQKPQIKELITDAENKGVEIIFFSSDSDAGKELQAFGSMAAFLRYELEL